MANFSPNYTNDEVTLSPNSTNSEVSLSPNSTNGDFTLSPNSTNDEFCVHNQRLQNFNGENVNDEISIPLSYWVNMFIICELPITTGFICVALNIVLKCRKLSFSIRYLSIMILVAFLSMAVVNLIFSVVRLTLGPNHCYYAIIFDTRSFISSVLLSVLWCTMCIVTIERFIAIVFPYRYVNYVTKRTAYVTVSFIWTSNIIIPVVLVFKSWLEVCGHYDYVSKCDIFNVYRDFRIFTSIILGISFATMITVYSKIMLTLRQHERDIRSLDVQSSCTTVESAQNCTVSTSRPSIPVILIIVLSFLVLQSPYLITFVTFELRPDLKLQKFRVFLQITCYVCHEIDTFVTLYLYIWRFPECRMYFYSMFAKVSDKYKAKAETLRLEVFNIVTFQRNHNISPVSVSMT